MQRTFKVKSINSREKNIKIAIKGIQHPGTQIVSFEIVCRVDFERCK